MEKQYAPSSKEKKVGKKAGAVKDVKAPVAEKPKQEEKKQEKEEKKIEETKKEEGKTEKKKKQEKVEIKPKEKAVAYGKSLRVSSKHCFAICKMIKGKTPDKAVELLEGVVKGKVVVRMQNREVAHQKSRGLKNIAGGKFPKKASLEMINLVKQLKANSDVCMVENPVIVIAKADKANRPYRTGRRRAKRTHVYLEARDGSKLRGKK